MKVVTPSALKTVRYRRNGKTKLITPQSTEIFQLPPAAGRHVCFATAAAVISATGRVWMMNDAKLAKRQWLLPASYNVIGSSSLVKTIYLDCYRQVLDLSKRHTPVVLMDDLHQIVMILPDSGRYRFFDTIEAFDAYQTRHDIQFDPSVSFYYSGNGYELASASE